MIEEKIKCIGEFIAYREIKANVKTAGGLVYDNSQIKNPIKKGVVLAVGDGRETAVGKVLPMRLKKGDIILFKTFVGHQWLVPGEEDIWFSREQEIVAILNE